jgi:hypothetical protein
MDVPDVHRTAGGCRRPAPCTEVAGIGAKPAGTAHQRPKSTARGCPEWVDLPWKGRLVGRSADDHLHGPRQVAWLVFGRQAGDGDVIPVARQSGFPAYATVVRQIPVQRHGHVQAPPTLCCATMSTYLGRRATQIDQGRPHERGTTPQIHCWAATGFALGSRSLGSEPTTAGRRGGAPPTSHVGPRRTAACLRRPPLLGTSITGSEGGSRARRGR